jgi:hypothetical protein
MVSYKPKKKSQNESVLKNLILKVLKGKWRCVLNTRKVF